MYKKIVSAVKTAVVPTVLSIFRITTQMGNTFFGTQKTFEYFGISGHPLELPTCDLATAISGADAIVNNAPYIYSRANNNTPLSDTASPASQLRLSTRVLYEGLRSLGPTSFTLSAVANILGAYVFASNIQDMIVGSDNSDEEWRTNSALSYALAATMCNFIFQWWQRNPRVELNVRRFAHALQNGEIHFDAKLAKATVLSLPTLSTPFIAYFSTESSLKNLPYIVLGTTPITTLSSASAFSAFFVNIFTEAAAVYDSIGQEEDNSNPKVPKGCQVYKGASYFFGGFNALVNYPAYTFISIANTFKSLGLNPYSQASIAFSVTCSVFKPIQVFAFSARQNYQGLLGAWLKEHPPEPDLEAGVEQPLLTEENQSFYGSSINNADVVPTSQASNSRTSLSVV
ncbi:MAG: hypothetical protein EPO11_09100 [Gammaproteobacteria bacterium]|nr:MAG: hypothetical protein EPO11_09100 [Gammaproteobacteria bacterium]